VSLPTPDAQSQGYLPQQPHSIPNTPPHTAFPSGPLTPTPSTPAAEISQRIAHERAVDFAARSWDLATDGLKTFTAKRELPARPERRVSEQLPDAVAPPRRSMFVPVILICILVMLVSGGIVLFLVLQP